MPGSSRSFEIVVVVEIEDDWQDPLLVQMLSVINLAKYVAAFR